jgi:hypothetical protein
MNLVNIPVTLFRLLLPQLYHEIETAVMHGNRQSSAVSPPPSRPSNFMTMAAALLVPYHYHMKIDDLYRVVNHLSCQPWLAAPMA